MIRVNLKELLVIVGGIVICFVAACITYSNTTAPVRCVSQVSGHNSTTVKPISDIHNFISDTDSTYTFRITDDTPNPYGGEHTVYCSTLRTSAQFGLLFKEPASQSLFLLESDLPNDWKTKATIHLEVCHVIPG